MNERDVELLLRRCRPAGPTAALRARVIASRGSIGWQLAAAAILIVMASLFQAGTARIAREIVAATGSDAVRKAEQVYLDEVGDDPIARSTAELVIAREQMHHLMELGALR